MKHTPLRAIPAVERVLQTLGETGLPRPLVVDLVREYLAELRKNSATAVFDHAEVRRRVEELRLSRIQPVINGTGILVHTNLGRAPLGRAVVETIEAVGADYNNLEFDLASGERGGRAAYLEKCLAALCGAEAATVANNCAAALILLLRHFAVAPRNEVVISRGELVQIGGGFRIPDILETSGARLREVGTTNKTSLGDYARAITKQTALMLRVHRSNFFMSGFVESPAAEDLSALAHKKKIPFVEDLGSGAMVNTESLAGLEHEPTPAEVLRRGVDLVCFSGDKLLGGPQAGIIAGKEGFVRALKKDPFFRALRCDKLILSALQTTAEIYLGDAGAGIPILELLRATTEDLAARARNIVEALKHLPVKAEIGAGRAQIGGGTLPKSVIPSVTIDLAPECVGLQELAERLRRTTPPVVGYISGQRYKIDLRTVFPRQDAQLEDALRKVLRERTADSTR
ncbi:MAG: L-seryl-tRNA(Sec) selenium transferase [Verrucomicrobia subdivision 3 bacterium]|nr:L-seryl-tRNA(Sec) selenium transferase [Limisphaerales bacterium]